MSLASLGFPPCSGSARPRAHGWGVPSPGSRALWNAPSQPSWPVTLAKTRRTPFPSQALRDCRLPKHCLHAHSVGTRHAQTTGRGPPRAYPTGTLSVNGAAASSVLRCVSLNGGWPEQRVRGFPTSRSACPHALHLPTSVPRTRAR